MTTLRSVETISHQSVKGVLTTCMALTAFYSYIHGNDSLKGKLLAYVAQCTLLQGDVRVQSPFLLCVHVSIVQSGVVAVIAKLYEYVSEVCKRWSAAARLAGPFLHP